ncbi:MAG: dihydrofolate reductase family protein [Mucilaginibacter sp.]|nr:dihydrofolate reductase family protein [Mucilaginibacter sp.]
MRKIIVLSFITLDGVMQGPGGPEEDTSNGFKLGGWTAPYGDEELGKVMQKQLEPADLLLGRKTFDIFADYWPKHAQYWPGIMEVNKYAFSNTLTESDWDNSHFLKTVDDIKRLKNSEGRDLKIWGSSELVKLLLKHDLIDEFWLNIYPIILGNGKKLFGNDAIPKEFELAESHITPKGVIVTNYKKSGEVKTGTVGPE